MIGFLGPTVGIIAEQRGYQDAYGTDWRAVIEQSIQYTDGISVYYYKPYLISMLFYILFITIILTDRICLIPTLDDIKYTVTVKYDVDFILDIRGTTKIK